MKNQILSGKIRTLADTNGIDVLGFADASAFSGYANPNSKRRDPKLSLTNGKTIIVAGIYIGGLTLPKWTDPAFGRTSRLFLSGYFLDVATPLKPVAELLQREGFKAIVCESSDSESSILPLKLAAVRAGLGWQGKQSLLVSRKYGTYLALGGILTDAELVYNKKEEPNRCQDCTRCQQACPMGALEHAHTLCKEKCLSLLFQRDEIPREARSVMENRVMDCEICQDICPWNAKHIESPLPTKTTASFQTKISKWENFFSLSNLATLTEQEYHNTLDHLNTTVPYSVFRRNVLLAMKQQENTS